MSLIKIINGTFGHRPAGSRSVEPKQAGDPPFEVDDLQARRLVARGVAVLIDEPAIVHVQPVATPQGGEDGTNPSDNPPSGDESSEGAEDAPDKPDYSEKMKADELRALMEGCGLKVKFGMAKVDMVAALDAYFADDTADDGEAHPNIVPEDPVT